MIGSWWPVAIGVAAGALGTMLWGPLRRKWRRARTQQADRQFHFQREWLEAKFFDLAAGSGKPRGLRWTDCRWDDDVTFARDRRNGRLTAFVGVSIRFEAVEDGPMQDVPAVAQEKVASAVFHYAHGRWGTGGRVLFNLRPQQALIRFSDQFERVGIY